MLAQNISGGGGDITTGLVGWWKFDDGSGTTAADSSGQGNTGTLSGSSIPTWVAPGKIGSSMLNFAGSGYVDCGTNLTLDPTAITLSAWVRPSSLPNSYNTVISRFATFAGLFSYSSIFVKSSGKLAMYVRGNNDISYDGSGTNTLSTNVWNQIVLTYDATNGLVGYVNASVDGTAASNGNLSQILATISIGTDLNTAGRDWNGDLDDVRFYNRALTQIDVTTLYNYT